MKVDEKFVYLSHASLKKVSEWCEANEDDPLAKAYMGASWSLASVDRIKIIDRLEKSSRGTRAWWGDVDIADHIEDLAFRNRDVVGRAILRMLKREQNG